MAYDLVIRDGRIVDGTGLPVDLTYPPYWDIWHPRVKNYGPHFTDMPVYRHSWLDR